MTQTTNPKPKRAPDVETSGEGKAPEDIQQRAASAYYAELFVDAMGDPRTGKAWWHLKLWERP